MLKEKNPGRMIGNHPVLSACLGIGAGLAVAKLGQSLVGNKQKTGTGVTGSKLTAVREKMATNVDQAPIGAAGIAAALGLAAGFLVPMAKWEGRLLRPLRAALIGYVLERARHVVSHVRDELHKQYASRE